MRTELRLLRLTRPYRGLLALGLVTTFLASLLDGFTLVILIPLLKHLFGTTGALTPKQVGQVAVYVPSLSAEAGAEAGDAETLKAGHEIFMANCVSCHGEDAKGKQDVGAPNLTDKTWIYGGDLDSVYRTIYAGRQGHMPNWKNRLSPAEIKLLALYVDSLGTAP